MTDPSKDGLLGIASLAEVSLSNPISPYHRDFRRPLRKAIGASSGYPCVAVVFELARFWPGTPIKIRLHSMKTVKRSERDEPG
jgi:hypothetical protein